MAQRKTQKKCGCQAGGNLPKKALQETRKVLDLLNKADKLAKQVGLGLKKSRGKGMNLMGSGCK